MLNVLFQISKNGRYQIGHALMNLTQYTTTQMINEQASRFEFDLEKSIHFSIQYDNGT